MSLNAILRELKYHRANWYRLAMKEIEYKERLKAILPQDLWEARLAIEDKRIMNQRFELSLKKIVVEYIQCAQFLQALSDLLAEMKKY
jgi:hypothetical protein